MNDTVIAIVGIDEDRFIRIDKLINAATDALREKFDKRHPPETLTNTLMVYKTDIIKNINRRDEEKLYPESGEFSLTFYFNDIHLKNDMIVVFFFNIGKSVASIERESMCLFNRHTFLDNVRYSIFRSIFYSVFGMLFMVFKLKLIFSLAVMLVLEKL